MPGCARDAARGARKEQRMLTGGDHLLRCRATATPDASDVGARPAWASARRQRIGRVVRVEEVLAARVQSSARPPAKRPMPIGDPPSFEGDLYHCGARTVCPVLSRMGKKKGRVVEPADLVDRVICQSLWRARQPSCRSRRDFGAECRTCACEPSDLRGQIRVPRSCGGGGSRRCRPPARSGRATRLPAAG